VGPHQKVRRHSLVKESQPARLVFVDIRPDTLNLEESQVQAAITDRTRVIAPVHYAGVSSDMETIPAIARANDLRVVEDAAQSVKATYRDEYSGMFGDFGCFSFYETKSFICGEGGALVVKDPSLFERAECIRDNGTNRRSACRASTMNRVRWRDHRLEGSHRPAPARPGRTGRCSLASTPWDDMTTSPLVNRYASSGVRVQKASPASAEFAVCRCVSPKKTRLGKSSSGYGE
jgi:hypothetical protein